jgi:CheY-like chemotaxis protein
VLVVDDVPFNIKVVCGMLKLLGIHAHWAMSGLQAIELIQKNDYDVVLMDHLMPDMDGVETTARIRAMGGKYEHMPIVALTASTIQGEREMFLANGFNDFASKPINSEELSRIMENWLPPHKTQANVNSVNPSAHLNAIPEQLEVF